MRKKLLGAMAALVAGSGGALAQSPTRGVARAGGDPDGGAYPVQYNEAIPPRLPGGPTLPPEMTAGPGGQPDFGPAAPGMGGPGGEPAWPVPGPYMQQSWERPDVPRRGLFDGLFGGPGGAPNNAPTLWFDGQYLLMFPKAMPINFPLVTTGAPAGLGVIGQPTTSGLHGNGDLRLGAVSGFRLTAGFFRPSDHRLGFELTGMYLSPSSNSFFGQSSGTGIPVIARPYFNVATGANAALIVSFPNFASGSIDSRAASEFWGMEANGLWNIYRSCGALPWTLNAVGGFRFNSLEESLDITQQSTLLPGVTAPFAGITVAAPTSLLVRDNFATSNRFYGGQIGLQSQVSLGRWYGGITAKVGFGVMHQEVRIDGASGISNPTAGTTAGLSSLAVGGLYANATNIGVFREDRFAVMTDINGTLGYNVNRFLTLTAGYNFIHMGAAARATEQFNGRVDPALIPTSGSFGGTAVAGQPAYEIKQTDYFMHGLNFGFIVRY